ncbi:MAG: bifunctional demethylmenaquinone methyltransferase/2-methoxy-6-polyprenyl-1,4-benzoquinol methylase UbiE [Acidobacteriia bacterium]|nr:bifunctional demethylmenaquinone methyltransferase/2-methoxy-6-polyprenyl-1,4-benzoquinol methylase UbiE [Terriglobia bacterium]
MKAVTPTDSQAGKAENVRAMFSAIAHRYDLANHVLSLNLDRRWRRFAIRQIVARLNRPDFDALDLACGTGDLTAALGAATRGRVVGLDFCHPMLVIGANKLAKTNHCSSVALSEADALNLPLRNATFDAVTIAFGLRNLEDYERGLSEMRRVLRPGGVLAVLEFSRPSIPVFRQVYQIYFSKILPWIGARLSGVEGPYDYLPDSVSNFPTREALKGLMERAGFADVIFFNLSGGVAALHLGTKV